MTHQATEHDGTDRRFRYTLVVIAAMAYDLFMFSQLFTPPEDATPSPVPVLVFATTAAVLLLLQRRALRTVLLLLCLNSILATFTIDYQSLMPLTLGLAVAGIHLPLRSQLLGYAAAAGTAAAWVYATDSAYDFTYDWQTLIGVYVLFLSMLAVGASVGWAIQLTRREAGRRLAEADRERAEAKRVAVSEERQRVAREMHDTVAHGVSMMTLIAGAARAIMATDRAEANRVLQVVIDTGTRTMSELRLLLNVLRTDTQEMHDHPTAPSGLAALPELVKSVKAAGVDVTVHHEGRSYPIDRKVEAAAFHVISESLTNVTKHAGVGARADVSVEWTPRQIEIDVQDHGNGNGGNGSLSTGNGLIGLRERVAMVRGTLDAHPTLPHGYHVHATLPTKPQAVF